MYKTTEYTTATMTTVKRQVMMMMMTICRVAIAVALVFTVTIYLPYPLPFIECRDRRHTRLAHGAASQAHVAKSQRLDHCHVRLD